MTTELLVPGGPLVPHLPGPLPRLSDNQKRCLQFIFQTLTDTREYPNQSEISLHAFGKRRRQYAHRLVEALEKKHCLARTAERTRNLKLTEIGLRCLERDGIDVTALLRAMNAREEGRGGYPAIDGTRRLPDQSPAVEQTVSIAAHGASPDTDESSEPDCSDTRGCSNG